MNIKSFNCIFTPTNGFTVLVYPKMEIISQISRSRLYASCLTLKVISYFFISWNYSPHLYKQKCSYNYLSVYPFRIESRVGNSGREDFNHETISSLFYVSSNKSALFLTVYSVSKYCRVHRPQPTFLITVTQQDI